MRIGGMSFTTYLYVTHSFKTWLLNNSTLIQQIALNGFTGLRVSKFDSKIYLFTELSIAHLM